MKIINQEEINHKLDSFFSRFKLLQFKKGIDILHAGDTPPGVFYLKQGYIRMYSISEEGKELTLNIFKPGSYFSMIWAIADIPNRYFFKTMTNVKLFRAPKQAFLSFINNNPEIVFDLTRRILVGLNAILTDLEHFHTGSAHRRVLSVLLLLSKRFGKQISDGRILIQLPLTHQEIANLAGITRETASIILKGYQNQKIISRQSHLFVIEDSHQLEKQLIILKKEISLPPSV